MWSWGLRGKVFVAVGHIGSRPQEQRPVTGHNRLVAGIEFQEHGISRFLERAPIVKCSLIVIVASVELVGIGKIKGPSGRRVKPSGRLFALLAAVYAF